MSEMENYMQYGKTSGQGAKVIIIKKKIVIKWYRNKEYFMNVLEKS